MDAELVEDLPSVAQDIHQVGDRRPLVPADVRDARLQQRLGDGEDPLDVEDVSLAPSQLLNLDGKGPFGHARLPSW